MSLTDDTPVSGRRIPVVYSDPPVSTPAESPYAKRRMRAKTSFPPGPKTSLGLALSLLGMAASSALGIPNPYHRTGAILACAVALYVIGLRTPTPKA